MFVCEFFERGDLCTHAHISSREARKACPECDLFKMYSYIYGIDRIDASIDTQYKTYYRLSIC